MKLPAIALLRAADLDRAIGRKLAAWHDDSRTADRYERNAARLEAVAREANPDAALADIVPEDVQ